MKKILFTGGGSAGHVIPNLALIEELLSEGKTEVFYMNPCELTAAVTAVANALACKLSDEELSLLASVLVQLGDTLVTIVTQRSICEKLTKKE